MNTIKLKSKVNGDIIEVSKEHSEVLLRPNQNWEIYEEEVVTPDTESVAKVTKKKVAKKKVVKK